MTAKEDAKRFYNKLKNQALENPLGALMIAALAVNASAKIMDANTQRKYAKVHEREVDRRIAMQYGKTR